MKKLKHKVLQGIEPFGCTMDRKEPSPLFEQCNQKEPSPLVALNRSNRIIIVFFVFVFCLVVIIGRLIEFQVTRAGELALWAVRQRGKSIVVGEGRGDILDRHGHSMLGGTKEELLIAFPSLYRGDEESLITRLHDAHLVEQVMNPPHHSFPFIMDRGEERSFSGLPASIYPAIVRVEVDSRYGSGVPASHVVGHIRRSDGVGQKGIELFFDYELSAGQPHTLSAFVDGRERLIPGLGVRLRGGHTDRKEPHNVVLTIDLAIQNTVETIMDKEIKKGAVVVMDPTNGDILAVASRPDYHPGAVEQYLGSNDGSFNNRAFRSYPPGSVFKTVLALAVLEEEDASLFMDFTCRGSIAVEDHVFRCPHLHHSHQVTLIDAFAYSCNTAFIQLGRELGPDIIHKYAAKLALGQKTGLPAGEDTGFIPGHADMRNEKDLANTSIGQGLVEVTPVQMARMMSVIANGGRMVTPRLVEKVTDLNGRTVKEYYRPGPGNTVISTAAVNRLKFMLNTVTESGTGREAATSDLTVGGKTGTAQSGRIIDGREQLYYWFAGFAPADEPQVVVVVMMEDGGNKSPGQIFRSIVQEVI